MIRRHLSLLILLLLGAVPAHAHRLDEYLQATILSIQQDHVDASMRLIPGIAVSASVIADIDTNQNGLFSPEEQQAYARRILGSLQLTLDADRLQLTLLSYSFPTPDQIREGLGEIHIDYTASLPRSASTTRKLVLQQSPATPNAAYLVNALAPTQPGIQITAQHRDDRQSIYELDYLQTSNPARTPPPSSFPASTVRTLFRLGMHHIAEGPDHLLFLLVLLLPAPLLASRQRWASPNPLFPTILRILRVVTAFTLGHSLTLALAAWGLLSVPSRPVEVFIALSILVSAVHALCPLFPGKEPAIAAAFGLIHGLAFAATLGTLGLTPIDRLLGLLAFNLGIETMQLLVVAFTMPSLILLSRTRAYPTFRIAGALVAAMAALAWIAQRLLDAPIPIDAFAAAATHHAPWLAASLFLFSILCLRPLHLPVK